MRRKELFMGKTTYQNHPRERFKEQAFIRSYQSPPDKRRGTIGVDSDFDPKLRTLLRERVMSHA